MGEYDLVIFSWLNNILLVMVTSLLGSFFKTGLTALKRQAKTTIGEAVSIIVQWVSCSTLFLLLHAAPYLAVVLPGQHC